MESVRQGSTNQHFAAKVRKLHCIQCFLFLLFSESGCFWWYRTGPDLLADTCSQRNKLACRHYGVDGQILWIFKVLQISSLLTAHISCSDAFRTGRQQLVQVHVTILICSCINPPSGSQNFKSTYFNTILSTFNENIYLQFTITIYLQRKQKR